MVNFLLPNLLNSLSVDDIILTRIVNFLLKIIILNLKLLNIVVLNILIFYLTYELLF